MYALKKFLLLLFNLLPILVIALFAHVFYVRIINTRVQNTIDDMVFFSNGLKSIYNGQPYKNFDADYISVSGLWPLDLKVVSTDKGNKLISRFEGNIVIEEAPKTTEERRYYFYMLRDAKMFKAHYRGLGAYIVLFAELNPRECVRMSTVDWPKFVPEFMGIEVSHVNEKYPDYAIDNLKYFVLLDEFYPNPRAQTNDRGKISRTPLNTVEALRHCACIRNTCTVALKFY